MKIYILNKATSQVFVEEMDTKPENTEQFIYTQTPYTIDYLKPDYNEQTNEWFETATPQEAIGTQIERETLLYKKRIEDGQNAIARISAEFRIGVQAGIMPLNKQLDLEALLAPVRNEILAGQWINAKRKLEDIGMETVGEPPYMRLLTEIDNYIAENYD